MGYIKQEDILNATGGGLDIILYYYPQARETLEGKKREFKIRDERTPSARLKQLKDGNWVVTDFGDDQVPKNGILICQKEEGISYREAIVLLANRYKIGAINTEIHKAGFEKRPAKKNEKEGEYYFDVKKNITEEELRVIGPRVTNDHCKKYYFHSLNSFIQIKNREALITSSNENYPIFLIDHSEWKKIYQPKNPEKQYRFRYYGDKPKNFINGLEQLTEANKKYLDEQQEINQEDEEKKSKKYPEAILCSGDRDALNIASLGYMPLWLNSETASLSGKDYKEIMKHCDTLYLLPDIDITGIKSAIKLGLQYMDIRIVWLPDDLKKYKDHRGNPRKDFTDYIELHPKVQDLKKLLRVAIPMRFWDEQYRESGIKYEFNNTHAYHFLQCNGFHRFENRNRKEGFIYIHMDNNIIDEVDPVQVKTFINNFLEKRHLPIPLRNMMYRTNQLNDVSLSQLKQIQIDFTDYDRHSQYLFFRNKTWKVTGKGIIEYNPNEVNKYVWGDEVIDHRVKKQDPPFNIKFDRKKNVYDIEITKQDSLFFCFLINTSRIHWREELENRISRLNQDKRTEYLKENRFKIDGELLSDEETHEQKLHLINKIFSIGYLLHRYKDPARPWCVFAMDNNISELGRSYGRSGKSVCYNALRIFMNSITLPGRNPKLTDNPHVYDRVTEHTDYIIVDDADMYLNFNFFFEPLTGPLVVNPKFNQSYEIPFDDVPKFCITSNFTLRNIDPSTEGRILYTVFSDYYHILTDDSSYNQDRTIADDLGKNLFKDDYTEEEWNNDFNFFASCLAFFLSVPSPKKINPPMDNVTRRNLKTEMGPIFENWASVYFSAENEKIDKLVSRDDALNDYINSSKQHRWTTQKFSRALKAWCRYNNYILNPEAFRNNQGRIIRKIDTKACEMIYIQTTEKINPEELNNIDPGDDPGDDLPF